MNRQQKGIGILNIASAMNGHIIFQLIFLTRGEKY